MIRTLLILCSVILPCLATTTHAADIIAKSCSNSVVQSAINSAVNGDRVLIPAGTCRWTTQVTIPNTKGITLQGSGIGTTTILSGAVDGVPGGALVVVVAPGNSLTRVTGFTMDAEDITKPSQGSEITVWGHGLDVFRVDHIVLDHIPKRGLSTLSNVAGDGSQELSGLIDHITCNAVETRSVQCFNVHGAWSADGQGAFDFPIQLGSNHVVYIEDSTCNYTGPADDCNDGFTGASFVFRYNTISRVSYGTHGADSSRRGVVTTEAYRNTSTNLGGSRYMANWRSGPSVMFDNKFTGGYSWVTFTLYRQDGPYGTAGKCDGLSPWDGNLIPKGQVAQGYPCLDQTGWFFPGAGPNGARAVRTPAYVFNNTLDGVSIAPQAGSVTTAPYIVNNRDYYNDVGASCSGSSCNTGVGIGPLSSRPANCTVGVGYWATDQGTWNKAGGENGVLYKCTATNKWSLYYTPYIYPHPLQTKQTLQGNMPSPAPPAGLTVK